MKLLISNTALAMRLSPGQRKVMKRAKQTVAQKVGKLLPTVFPVAHEFFTEQGFKVSKTFGGWYLPRANGKVLVEVGLDKNEDEGTWELGFSIPEDNHLDYSDYPSSNVKDAQIPALFKRWVSGILKQTKNHWLVEFRDFQWPVT